MNIFRLELADVLYLPWLSCASAGERVAVHQMFTVCPESFVTVYYLVLFTYNRRRKVVGLEKYSLPIKYYK
jgi:hypothetical protein